MAFNLGGYVFDVPQFEDGRYLDFMSIEGTPYPRHLAIFAAWLHASSQAQENLLAGLVATSDSAVTVGSGPRAFAVGAGGASLGQPGLWVIAQRTADPAGTWMLGRVTAYEDGTLTLDVPAGGFAGEGSHSDWTLGLSGPPGPQGIQGEPGVATPGEIWGFILSTY